MIDKELFKLIGGNKKYIFIAVLLQAIGLVANVAITGSVCYAVYLLTQNVEGIQFMYPLIGAAIGIIVRYICSRATGDIKDKLGRSVKKDLRERVYNKIVKLGVKTTDGMSMAGLTQVSVEGVRGLEQSNRRIYTVLTICTFDAQRKMRYNKVAEKTAWSLKKE